MSASASSTSGRLAYLTREIPRRAVRASLCRLFDVRPWHIASGVNKPYVHDILAYLKARQPRRVVEVGCGFCDILSHLHAPVRLGFDANANVLRAARLYTRLKGAAVSLQQHDLIQDGVPAVDAEAWILVNWLHEFAPDPVARRLREVFAQLPPAGVMIFDTVLAPPYRYAHDARAIMTGLPCRCEAISRGPDGRVVWAAERIAGVISR